jgi:hypothetical protein
MFSYAGTPSGIVIMQSQDLFTIAAHPATFQGAYINGQTMYSSLQPMSVVDVSMPMTPNINNHNNNNNNNNNNDNDCRLFSANRQNSSFINRSNGGYYSHTSPIRRTRMSGHVSKSKVIKRNTDLTKICPSCSKLWRLCNCSNVKNRPAPKPYCKFVPPRMLNQKKN